MVKVIKRDGREVEFDPSRIIAAISAANKEVVLEKDKISESDLKIIANIVTQKCEDYIRAINVEEIQNIVETALIKYGSPEVAKAYIRYRYKKTLRRNGNNIDDAVLALVGYANEEVKQENSNKNPEIIPTQRDYIAGEVSKDITMRKLLPQDIVDAHKEGVIHFHDADYFIQPSHNCCLVNLEDMLQNGTVISGTLIEKPHTFSTACNIATQIVATVASSQYGGQTFSLAHLAPFVDDTRKKFYKEHLSMKDSLGEKKYTEFIEQLVREDITRGIQTIQYQLITLQTTNGQAPFVTMFLNINEAPEGQTRDDLAYLIGEVLRQRIEGVKNEQGVFITPAFPKLIYVLDENNVREGTEFFYLTKLAAQCTAKRMVPDYISAKIMRRDKGDVYPCMG